MISEENIKANWKLVRETKSDEESYVYFKMMIRTIESSEDE